jgi:hypothetical protein
MTIAVMQPYVFPYLGYYQLVKAVDNFVFFDDVNFINKGWINRNQILQQNEAYKFTIPLHKASQNRMINEIELAEFDKWRKDFLKRLELNYRKAPFFSFFYQWLQNFFHSKEFRYISEIAEDSVQNIARLLELPTTFMKSSNLPYRESMVINGQEKVLRICNLLNADKYINPQNGMDIYEQELFDLKKVDLKFIRMDTIVYDQFENGKFSPYLSIIDVLMFNDVRKCQELLTKYTLINKKDHGIS